VHAFISLDAAAGIPSRTFRDCWECFAWLASKEAPRNEDDNDRRQRAWDRLVLVQLPASSRTSRGCYECGHLDDVTPVRATMPGIIDAVESFLERLASRCTR